MSRNDIFATFFGIIFLIAFMYFIYTKNYLISTGWLILSISAFLEAYNPRDTGYREITILINVILPFIAILIFIYALFFTY